MKAKDTILSEDEYLETSVSMGRDRARGRSWTMFSMNVFVPRGEKFLASVSEFSGNRGAGMEARAKNVCTAKFIP